MCGYDVIAKGIRPLRQALAEAEGKHAAAAAVLAGKQAELAAVQARRDALLADQAEASREKQSLERQRQQGMTKLDRAGSLMRALGSEKDGWRRTC